MKIKEEKLKIFVEFSKPANSNNKIFVNNQSSLKMQSIKNFNDFLSFQSNIFKNIFDDVEKVPVTSKPKVNKQKAIMSNLAFMETPRSSRNKADKAQETIEKAIQEVKKKVGESSSKFETPTRTKLPKKDVKRLGREIARNHGGMQKKEEDGSSTSAENKKNGGNKVKTLTETIVYAPEFEIID